MEYLLGRNLILANIDYLGNLHITYVLNNTLTIIIISI